MDEARRVIARLEPLLTARRCRRMREVLSRRSDHVAFVFEQMTDPHNLSAALRSLDAFGFQDAHLIRPGDRLGLGRGIARGITIGSERWLSLHRHADAPACVAALKAAGYRVYASHLDDEATGEPLAELDFSRRVALVFGNEHAGVGRELLALADGRFHIAMHGFVQSLNLSVAVAVCAFHARQRLLALEAREPAPARFVLAEARREALYADWLRASVRRADEILAEEAN